MSVHFEFDSHYSLALNSVPASRRLCGLLLRDEAAEKVLSAPSNLTTGAVESDKDDGVPLLDFFSCDQPTESTTTNTPILTIPQLFLQTLLDFAPLKPNPERWLRLGKPPQSPARERSAHTTVNVFVLFPSVCSLENRVEQEEVRSEEMDGRREGLDWHNTHKSKDFYWNERLHGTVLKSQAGGLQEMWWKDPTTCAHEAHFGSRSQQLKGSSMCAITLDLMERNPFLISSNHSYGQWCGRPNNFGIPGAHFLSMRWWWCKTDVALRRLERGRSQFDPVLRCGHFAALATCSTLFLIVV